MSQDDLEIPSADQTRLFVRRFKPAGQPKARLLWLHGYAEHSGRYVETLRWFAQHGFESQMLDWRGHGRSGGRRIYINRFSDYLDDLEAFYRHARDPDAPPTFWIAHSMGGLVLARFLQAKSECLSGIAGAVILSPFMGAKIHVPAWKKGVARVMSLILPRVSLASNISTDVLSKDPAVGVAYNKDPLITNRATARWFTETLKAQELAIAEASKITLPILVMHGLDDGLADVESTKRFFENIASEEKELKLWEGLRHELLNEVEKEPVREYLHSWFESPGGRKSG